MKDLVSDRLLGVVATLSVLGLTWTLFVSAGRSWPAMMALAVLGTLLITTTTILLLARRRGAAASLSQTILDVEAETAAKGRIVP